jgi:hypothetical protein
LNWNFFVDCFVLVLFSPSLDLLPALRGTTASPFVVDFVPSWQGATYRALRSALAEQMRGRSINEESGTVRKHLAQYGPSCNSASIPFIVSVWSEYVLTDDCRAQFKD